ncbi:MAG: alpha/beta fold hydrolase [Acidobacteriia bacterium]|nr:alpha/beta fold hydrolase [Terriglobia bacterium]
MKRSVLLLALVTTAAWAQLTPADTVFAGLSARTRSLAYRTAGGDMTAISPLMSQQNYRSLTHAMVLMEGHAWTPDNELPTLLDFSISSKIVSTGENLSARATFLFDAPQTENGPYRMRLDLLKADGTQEAAVEPGINIGAARNRKSGEFSGLSFDPSKLVQPGLHTIKATLEDSSGKPDFEYYRTFVIVSDLNKRVAALEKTLELLPDQKSPQALEARHTLETVKAAHAMYYAPGFQGLAGYVFTGMRASGLGLKEAFDYEAGLARATKIPPPDRGDLFMAYRSPFDGKLVPYRVYVPTTYDKSKKYPLVVLLHGAGGDETDFMDAYQGQWPKLAEQRGYILASVTGRGPLSGYSKESGGEQDVLDVMALVKSNYNIGPVFLGGHSMGGAGTWRLGTLYADRFAGLIPIAGTSAQVQLNPKMPVMIVCGVKDALVAVAGCRAVAEKAKSMPVKYSEYANGDHLSVAVMSIPDIFNWLDQQTKERP